MPLLAMTAAIPDNLLEGDVTYLPPERVGARVFAPPGSPLQWPSDCAIPVLGERMEAIRRAGRLDQNDLYCGMMRALYLHPNAETAAQYRQILLAWQPRLEVILRQIGVGWASRDHPGRGARYLRLATRLAPDSPEARHDLGVCLHHLAQQHHEEGELTESARVRQEADRCLDEARQMAPDMEAKALAEIGGVLVEARELLRRGEARPARGLLLGVTQRQPGNGIAWTLLGTAHRMLGQCRYALAALEQAVNLAPESPEPRNEQGITLCLRREYEAAESAFREAARLEPDQPGYLCNLALALLSAHRFQEARETLERAEQLAPLSEQVAACRRESARFAGPFYRLLRRFIPLPTGPFYRPLPVFESESG